MTPLELHVLVVDDEPDARELVALALERVVTKVDVAASAKEAFEKIVAAAPDLLLSDICMPIEDGWSLIRRVRAHGGAFPAFALTALATDVDIARTRAAGFDLVLTKPIDMKALFAAMAGVARNEPPRKPAPWLVRRLRHRALEAKRRISSALANTAKAREALRRGLQSAVSAAPRVIKVNVGSS